MAVDIQRGHRAAFDFGGSSVKALCRGANGREETLTLDTHGNFWGIGVEGVRDRVHDACQVFDTEPGALERLEVFVAGLDQRDDFEKIRVSIQESGVQGEIIIDNDTGVGLKALSAHPERMTVIGGTGANCVGEFSVAPGRRLQHGGTGHTFSDRHGGGVGIGIRAVEAAIDECNMLRNRSLLEAPLDSFEPAFKRNVALHGSALLKFVLQHFSIDEMMQVSRIVYSATSYDEFVGKFAVLAKKVSELASNGDERSLAILEETGSYLGNLAGDLAKLALESRQFDTLDIAHIGSLLTANQGDNPIGRKFEATLRKELRPLRITHHRFGAPFDALRIIVARDSEGPLKPSV